MANYFESKLKKTYEELREKQKLKRDYTLLKTYIIESNLKDLTKFPKVNGYTYNFTSTEDASLKIFDVIKEEDTEKEDKQNITSNRFFIDTLDPRFWVIHTLGKSDETDHFIYKLINKPSSGLDMPWFTNKFNVNMRNTQGFIFKGFSVKYDDFFEEDIEDEQLVSSLYMKLRGTTADEIYDILRKNSRLKNKISLSGMSIKYIDETNRDEFIIEEITSQGKFTCRGTSYSNHVEVFNKFKESYNEKINEIEKHWISYKRGLYGYTIDGKPISIELQRDIPNLKTFLEKLLSSSEPFRIWGLYKFLKQDYAKVKAIDLHTGHELSMEVAPKWIRIYLPKYSCGNTILRLCYFIQHYYDSDAKIVGGDDGEII